MHRAASLRLNGWTDIVTAWYRSSPGPMDRTGNSHEQETIVCLVYFILLFFIASRSDISAGNSLSVPQYSAVPSSCYTGVIFLLDMLFTAAAATYMRWLNGALAYACTSSAFLLRAVRICAAT